jgi:hypothetical protein
MRRKMLSDIEKDGSSKKSRLGDGAGQFKKG